MRRVWSGLVWSGLVWVILKLIQTPPTTSISVPLKLINLSCTLSRNEYSWSLHHRYIVIAIDIIAVIPIYQNIIPGKSNLQLSAFAWNNARIFLIKEKTSAKGNEEITA